MVCTYGACDGNGTWNQHLQDPLKEMKLPDDPAGDGHLLFEVHCYPNIENLSSAKGTVNATIQNLKQYLVKKGAPVIIGEWGISGNEGTRASHLAFAKFFAQRCKDNGLGFFHWMGLTDGSSRTKPEFNEQDLVDAIMEGYYGEGGYQSGVEIAELPARKTVDVYSLSGVRLLRGILPCQARKRLPKGVYIIEGRKCMIR